LADWIGLQGQSKLIKNFKNPPLWELLPGEPPIQIKKFFSSKLKVLPHS